MKNIDVSVLTDKELVATWGWMQNTMPATAPFAIAMKAELSKRKLEAPFTPIDFSKINVIDLTKKRVK